MNNGVTTWVTIEKVGLPNSEIVLEMGASDAHEMQRILSQNKTPAGHRVSVTILFFIPEAK